MDSGTTETLNSVWGTSANEVFVVGENGTMLRYNGSVWSGIPIIKRDYHCIFGTSSPNIFAVGKNGKISYYQSGRLTDMQSGTTQVLLGVWVSSSNDAFAVGSNGTILLYSESVSSENTPPAASFTVTPSSGDQGTTFYVDASGSTDVQDASDVLQVQWDWESDGVWDTEWTTTKIASHQYASRGSYSIQLKVKDSGGLTATSSQTVTVTGAGTENCPAEAALGASHPDLDTLRLFRDRVLSQSSFGIRCIGFYYSHRETVTALVETHPAFASVVKTCIRSLVPVIEQLL